jgi:hypothetical protein
MNTAQSNTDTEGIGRALMRFCGSLTETTCQGSSGNSLLPFSSVEDVRVALPQPLSPCELIVRLKQITGRMLGTLKPQIGRTRQRPEGEGKKFVNSRLCLPLCVRESSCRAAGPGSPLAFGVGGNLCFPFVE